MGNVFLLQYWFEFFEKMWIDYMSTGVRCMFYIISLSKWDIYVWQKSVQNKSVYVQLILNNLKYLSEILQVGGS